MTLPCVARYKVYPSIIVKQDVAAMIAQLHDTIDLSISIADRPTTPS